MLDLVLVHAGWKTVRYPRHFYMGAVSTPYSFDKMGKQDLKIRN